MIKLAMIFISMQINIKNAILKLLTRMLWPIRNRKYENICIYRLGNVGDILCTLPALYQIRKQFPNAHITLLSSPGKRGAIGADTILEIQSIVNNIVMYYSDDIDSNYKILKFLKNQRNYHYDYLIHLPAEASNFRTQLRNIIFVKMMHVKYSEGYYVSTSRMFAKGQSIYFNFPCEEERLINGLSFGNKNEIIFPINIKETDKSYVDKLLLDNNISKYDRIMAISHGGKAKANLWPVDRFKEISDKWISNGGKTIIIGGKGEFEEGQKIITSREKVFNYCGLCTIGQSLYLLSKVKFLLTIETGTIHMASAMNTPCITLSSSRYFPQKWAGYGEHNWVLRKNLDCSPCLQKVCKYGDNRCMNEIKVDEVWDLIIENFIEDPKE